MSREDGMHYAPKGKPNPVVKEGEFSFAAIGLDHGHIYGMCNGLIEAGGCLKRVYDKDIQKSIAFKQQYPQVEIVSSEEEILNDPEIKLVAGATITSERCDLGLRVMNAGKDYFTDKAPLTTLEQLERAKEATQRTGRKYMVYYSERIHEEAAVFADELIKEGAIGRVIQVLGMGPHRLRPAQRPDWFFVKEKYGGILCDIGSHQIEQFLSFSGAKDAQVVTSQIANYNHEMYPELDDYGDAMLLGDNGAVHYFRVDWFTPDGLRTWGDGRTFIQGTKGYIELRKYLNLASENDSKDHLYLVNEKGEYHYELTGKVGYPFFGQLILDCINRSENAMTQDHAFKAAELSIKAQMAANKIE